MRPLCERYQMKPEELTNIVKQLVDARMTVSDPDCNNTSMQIFWPFNWGLDGLNDAMTETQTKLMSIYDNECAEAEITIGTAHDSTKVKVQKARMRYMHGQIPHWQAYILDLVDVIVLDSKGPTLLRRSPKDKERRLRDAIALFPKKDRYDTNLPVHQYRGLLAHSLLEDWPKDRNARRLIISDTN